MSTHWIQTYTMRRFDLLEPTVDMVDPHDIAHALSLINRYTGHIELPYSVAQHCVVGSYVAEYQTPRYLGTRQARLNALEFLTHDASEAYSGDVSSPLKRAMRELGANRHGKSPYDTIEARIQRVVADYFGLRRIHSERTRTIDLRMLTTEALTVLPGMRDDWIAPEAPYTDDEVPGIMSGLTPWSPAKAEALWLFQLARLTDNLQPTQVWVIQ